MTESQIQSRLAKCETCERKPTCRETYLAYDSQTFCPLHKWPAESIASSLQNFQFGDAAKRIADPVARVFDYITHTKLQSCRPCAERRNLWNQGGVDIPPTP
jgi:hypothetical protein